jgi:tetratricopeptide (TPR) repeat protein
MTKTKKIKKKKLKDPDEFITLTERTYLFITQHTKSVAIGGIIILILILSIVFFQRWEKKNEENAQQMFNIAIETYQMVSRPYREGSPQDYKNVSKKFDEVIEKFPRTSAGRMSILYKGNIHLRLGEFEEAIKDYESFLKKGGGGKIYRSFAIEGLSYAYEGKKDYEKALNHYKKMIESGENFQLSSAYLGMGRCYEKLGKNNEALESYKSFLKVSKKSIMDNIVLRKISDLEK